MERLTKKNYKATTLRPDGSVIHCKECGFVTGYIYERAHKYIGYNFLCKCSNEGKIELYRGRKPKLERPKRRLYKKDNVHICPNCETPLFWVKEDAVEHYAFNVVCKCGVEYDLAYESKRGKE